jgi:PP-loop superfamily ATP-utilizing enzyme
MQKGSDGASLVRFSCLNPQAKQMSSFHVTPQRTQKCYLCLNDKLEPLKPLDRSLNLAVVLSGTHGLELWVIMTI